jgi:hypothetical protein
MKSLLQLLILVALVCSLSHSVAEDKTGSPNDPVTLKGKITCARCELNDAPKCHTVIVVRQQNAGGNGNNNDNEDDEVYYFDVEADKKYHTQVCEQGVNGAVVGLISEKNGVKYIKVSKLAFKSQGEPK